MKRHEYIWALWPQPQRLTPVYQWAMRSEMKDAPLSLRSRLRAIHRCEMCRLPRTALVHRRLR